VHHPSGCCKVTRGLLQPLSRHPKPKISGASHPSPSRLANQSIPGIDRFLASCR
jgi:hypothetical protein